MTNQINQAKEALTNLADTVDEIARRLREPNPAPEILEAAAVNLGILARTLRETLTEGHTEGEGPQ
jgi:hypothetical protein